MNAYIYAADLWCESCALAIRRRLSMEGNAPTHTRQENTFDSDEYPKGPFTDGGGESDTPQHCAAGPDCCQSTVLSDGTRIGLFLENSLTQDGVKYVYDTHRAEPTLVTMLWMLMYSEEVDWYRTTLPKEDEEDDESDEVDSVEPGDNS